MDSACGTLSTKKDGPVAPRRLQPWQFRCQTAFCGDWCHGGWLSIGESRSLAPPRSSPQIVSPEVQSRLLSMVLDGVQELVRWGCESTGICCSCAAWMAPVPCTAPALTCYLGSHHRAPNPCLIDPCTPLLPAPTAFTGPAAGAGRQRGVARAPAPRHDATLRQAAAVGPRVQLLRAAGGGQR